jgi:hypothetical protein
VHEAYRLRLVDAKRFFVDIGPGALEPYPAAANVASDGAFTPM